MSYTVGQRVMWVTDVVNRDTGETAKGRLVSVIIEPDKYPDWGEFDDDGPLEAGDYLIGDGSCWNCRPGYCIEIDIQKVKECFLSPLTPDETKEWAEYGLRVIS